MTETTVLFKGLGRRRNQPVAVTSEALAQFEFRVLVIRAITVGNHVQTACKSGHADSTSDFVLTYP